MIGVRGWLTAAAVFAGFLIVWSVVAGALSDFLLLFAAVLFAAGLRPIVDRLSARMPFAVAAGIVFTVFLLLVVLITYLLTAPIVAEVQGLLRALPGYLNELQVRFTAAHRFVASHAFAQAVASNVAANSGPLMASISGFALRGPALAVTLVSDTAIIFLLAVGWMLAEHDLAVFILSLLPPQAAQDWKQAFETIANRLSAYVQGVVLNGAIVGVAVGIALAWLGIPYALLLGFVVAILQAIPMIGAVISGVILLLVVLAISGWAKMVIVLVVLAIVQIIDQNVLSPVIFGKSVQLSFLLIIFSTVVGGTLLGIPGAFLAVPAAAVLQVIVTLIVAPAIRRMSGA
jgi:predicted PurR-regulated permease PerM